MPPSSIRLVPSRHLFKSFLMILETPIDASKGAEEGRTKSNDWQITNSRWWFVLPPKLVHAMKRHFTALFSWKSSLSTRNLYIQWARFIQPKIPVSISNFRVSNGTVFSNWLNRAQLPPRFQMARLGSLFLGFGLLIDFYLLVEDDEVVVVSAENCFMGRNLTRIGTTNLSNISVWREKLVKSLARNYGNRANTHWKFI